MFQITNSFLNRAYSSLNLSIERLSTGVRINSGRDDPAGLIVSEMLRSESSRIEAAIGNSQRASHVVSTADAALGEVNSLLTELNGLVVASANTGAISDAEIAANQIQIDSILDSINRISGSTSFADKKLLTGDLGYTLSGVSAELVDVDVHAAHISDGVPLTIDVEVTQSAHQGELTYLGSGLGSSNSVSIEVSGNLGSEVITLAASATNSAIALAVNQTSDATGVSASATGSAVVFNSTDFGANAFVSVQEISGDFAVIGGSGGKDFGEDAEVLINGISATTDGLSVSLRTSSLSVDLDLSEDFGASTGTTSFAVVGGGADFAISPDVDANGVVSIGIPSILTASLGNSSVGRLSSLSSGGANSMGSGNFAAAQQIVRDASNQVAGLRGRLGAFQKNTLEPTVSSLQQRFTGVVAAESAIRDTDFAMEVSNLLRSKILFKSGIRMIGIARDMSENTLALLS